MPKVSVIMPVYNAEKYIAYAMESILNQTYEDLELILIDDKGYDKSMDIARGYNDARIVILENECNKGIAYSRNRGIDYASGEYIAIMDDDDWTPEYRIKEEVEYLDSHPEMDVVGGAMNVIDESNAIKRLHLGQVVHNPKRIRAELMFHNMVPSSSAMIRKRFIEKNKLKYSDNMLGMEDYEFWTRCSLYGNITNLDKVMLHWRETTVNVTHEMRYRQAERRKERFKEIQKRAFLGNRFVLSKEELDLLCMAFPESGMNPLDEVMLSSLFYVFKKMIMQSKDKDYACEFEYVSKMMFSSAVQRSQIWRNE